MFPSNEKPALEIPEEEEIEGLDDEEVRSTECNLYRKSSEI